MNSPEKAFTMSGNHQKVGSQWTRWDLHLHSPGTKLSSGYGVVNDEAWDKYLTILEQSEVKVFGITDYFSLDGYRETVRRYSEKFSNGEKIFFPNVELRLTESVSNDARNVHTHILFDNDQAVCTPEKLDQVLADLETHITRNGANLRCSELSSQSDFESATVSISELQKVLKKVFGKTEPYLIITAANNDGLRGVNTKSARSLSISDELDKVSHAFFGSSKNTDHFLDSSRYETDESADEKPVFCGSDAHSFNDLDRLSGDEPNFEPTWVKADPTFRGLRQTLFEPKGRVHIGEKPTVLVRQNREATRFIDKLDISSIDGYQGENGTWFDGVEIPFNPELTAIIGNKGSGKSAIADIIALLAESRQEEYFSFLTDDSNNRKFRRAGYAENFNGQLTWKSATQVGKRLSDPIDTSKPEAVKYLPQNYFESLTNEIEVSALRREIEEVVFSHVPETDRMGKSKFAELEDVKTAQSKSEISSFKTRLRELNIEIIELEEQADPRFKKSLEEKLKTKREEYAVLETSKPKAVPKPDQETDEQKKVSQQISDATTELNALGAKGKLVVDRLALLKSQLQKAGSLREAIVAIESNVKAKKEELTVQCKALNLDIDQIVKHKNDLTPVDQKISTLSDEIKVIETDNHLQFKADTDFSVLESYPDLVAAFEHIESSIKTLKETLSAPQKRYQNYLQAMNEISTKQAEIMGNDQDPKPDTIKFIEHKISYINDELNPKIEEKIELREELSRSIFECKTKVRAFYESLKSSVETLLQSVSATDFSVTIDASFVPDHELDDLILEQINQNVKGPFKGTVDGMRAVQKMISEVDWNQFESVLSFANSIIEKVKSEPVGPQINDIKRFYDFLFSFEYFEAKYELRLGGKNLNELSPGEKGLLLLVFYLHLDKEKTPLIIDQPEDNLDNDSIFSVLAKCIRQAKKNRQVILVTHNPNLAVGADAEQIIYVKLEKHKNYKFSYECGSIENPAINDAIVKVLEGSRPAFIQRRLKYQIQ